MFTSYLSGAAMPHFYNSSVHSYKSSNCMASTACFLECFHSFSVAEVLYDRPRKPVIIIYPSVISV